MSSIIFWCPYLFYRVEGQLGSRAVIPIQAVVSRVCVGRHVVDSEEVCGLFICDSGVFVKRIWASHVLVLDLTSELPHGVVSWYNLRVFSPYFGCQVDLGCRVLHWLVDTLMLHSATLARRIWLYW